MKINVLHVITAHTDTLRDDRTKKISTIDVFVFYFTPCLLAVYSIQFDLNLKNDFFNLSITFFGIFVALLLNIQIAIYAIFQRKIEPYTDDKEKSAFELNLADRNRLLGELNTNISYLIVLSSVALVAFLVFFATDSKNKFISAFSILIYTHFILTFFMIIKRSFVLFQREYDN